MRGNLRRLIPMLLIGTGIIICCVGSLSAATIIGTAPGVSTGNALLDATLSAVIADAFNTAILDANNTLSKYHDQQQLARGFGNANVYSSQVASFQGFQNYDHFAVAAGGMVGVHMPSSDPNYYENLDDELEKTGDIFAGVGASASFLNVGINAKSIRPGLYLNFKFGSASVEPVDEVKFSNTIVGVGANYTLAKPMTGSFLFKWRGLSLGTGLIYHNSDVTYAVDIDKITEEFVVNYGGYKVSGDVVIDPSVNLELKVKTLTVPVDIMTSVRLLWLFNVTLGAGMDFNFGNTDLILISNGSVTIDIQQTPIELDIKTTPGTAVVDGFTLDVSPSFARFRLNTGVGFNFGPLKIDIPVSYYPRTGIAAGVTLGVVL